MVLVIARATLAVLQAVRVVLVQVRIQVQVDFLMACLIPVIVDQVVEEVAVAVGIDVLKTVNGLLGQEWMTLQNNYEQYEKIALFIKLTSVILFFIGLVMSVNGVLSGLIILVLWLQEGIWKTYQSRIGDRILMIESAIKHDGNAETAAFQLHSIWQAGRSGTLGLVREYLTNSIRPTVAYPYGILVLVNWVVFFI